MAETSFWRSPQIPYLESRYSANGHTCYTQHTHREFSIGLVESGKSHAQIGGQHLLLQPGDLVLINAEEVHACNPQANSSWSYHMLYFDPEWWRETAWELTDRPGAELFPKTVISGSHLGTALAHINFGFIGQSPPQESYWESRLLEWLSQLLEINPGQSPISGQTAKEYATVENLKSYLHSHLESTVQLKELCDIAHRSPGAVIRLFKCHTGMTPYAYLQNHRINRVKSLLRTGQPITEVAQSLGFADQSHLNRVFKRHVATTPRRYQKP